MNKISSLVLASAMFIGCDDSKQQEDSLDNGRFAQQFASSGPYKVLPLSDNELESTENFDYAMAIFESVVKKYDLQEQVIRDLEPLLDSLTCKPLGAVIGATQITDKDSSEGYWKIRSFHEFDEVVAQDKGQFIIGAEGYGEVFSVAGDSEIDGRLRGDGRNFSMIGQWGNDLESGEMVLLKLDMKGENMFGIWTICD